CFFSRASMSENMARIFFSETGLSTTTTSDGLLDEARTRPQVPSSSVTRTPFTVTSFMIFWPRMVSPFACNPSYSFTIASTMPYFLTSGAKGAMVGEPHVLGRSATSSDIFFPPARSSISSTGMAGLPIVGRRAVLFQYGIDFEDAGGFDVDDEFRVALAAGEIARQEHADLVGENLRAGVIHDAAAVAVAVEAETKLRLVRLHRIRHRVQHVQVFGVRIVFGKGVVELGIERHDVGADALQRLRSEGAGRAVAARRDDADRPRELVALGESVEIGLAEIRDAMPTAAGALLAAAFEYDCLQPRHVVRAEGERALGAHLHAGPAVLVVARRDHRDRRTIERELREVGHRGKREADVVHLATGRRQPDDQRLLDRERIRTEVVADGDARRDAGLVQKRAEAKPERLDAEQVEFLAEQPARVIFAKAVRGDERLVLEVKRVGLEV